MPRKCSGKPLSSLLVRALRSHVQDEPVFDEIVVVLVRDLLLNLFDVTTDELRHLAGFETHHMVVVRTMVELVNRMSAFEILPGNEPNCLELRKNPVYGRQADILALPFQTAIYLLCAEVSFRTILKQLQDFSAWSRGL